MFNDPAGQYRFEVPLGWAYDPERSHLITVRFNRWDRPGETVSVRAMPTFAPTDASLEQWHDALKERCFPPRMLPLVAVRCGDVPAVLVEAHETDPETVHRRLLIVRGTRLDILAEHRAPEPSTGPLQSEVLAAICRSIKVPTNRFLPAFVEADEVMGYLERARDAGERQAWGETLGLTAPALRAAQSTYLYSIVANTPLPEIPAIIALIDALMLSAQATASHLPLRDAEHLALRALYTVQRVPFLRRERRLQVEAALHNRLTWIADLQVKIAQPEKADVFRPAPGFGLSLLRVDPLLKQTARLTEEGQPTLALWHCDTVVADLMVVLSTLQHRPDLIRADRLGPELVEKLTSSGARTPEAQEQFFAQLTRRSQLETLQHALAFRANLQSLVDDVIGAAETSEFLVTIAQALERSEETITGSQIVPSEEQPSRLAHALIQAATSLAEIEDEPSLEEAHQRLDEAEGLLNQIGEEGALRAWLCLVRASVLHSQRRLEGAIEVIDRGLLAAATAPEQTHEYVRELKTIKSQFLIHARRLQEARALAAEVAHSPEGNDDRSRLRWANYYLNLAIVDEWLDNPAEAELSLREALRRILDVAPFGEEAFRILMVASRHYGERNVALSHQLNLAAAVTLDARRAMIPSDRFRIGFDESTRRREVYEDLVGRLATFGANREAVAVADRSRARSLNELLAAPSAEESLPTLSPTEMPPTLDGTDVRQAFWDGSEFVIRSADELIRRRGSIPPLSTTEIEALAKEIGVPALVIQPVRQQLALLLVWPSGEVEAHFSPVPLGEVRTLVDAVQQQFFIYSVPRGHDEDAAAESKTVNQETALRELWQALIGPVQECLVDGQPLVIVPYRDLTMVPFALLHDPEGRPLVERHALSVVPSLATMWTLRERKRVSQPQRMKAYIAGDPAVDPGRLLRRLPAARTEAEAVAMSLKAAGLGDDDIILRLNEAAHEQSYRREALGCNLVHISCHAELNEPAYTSCLYFAPHGHYDGMLLASEVADVKLDDALVVLAACETGQGRATADGVIGLGRAFFEAGARAVVLSLWKVEDAATAALSGHFYRALFEKKKSHSVAEALRIAMLATRADLEAGRVLGGDERPLAAHPAHWAPFIVLGDGLSDAPLP